MATMGHAELLRGLIDKDAPHRVLYAVFLGLRDAAANILVHTLLPV
jgi:hypothetical protein